MTVISVSESNTPLAGNLTPWDWPHAPAHRLGEKGPYMVTARTCEKRRFLNSPDRFDLVLSLLFGCAAEFKWQ